ncbi:hypothetical protein [Chryseobacterium sp. IT-36CA2]|uniref:hypothetical protein n=1 Tax=Chryseobacterium sp. IT-36CA2 TaxID=3026460 RepID=UPI0039DF329D
MKKTLFLPALLAPVVMFSQVGIYTPSPGASLDITAKNTTGTSSKVEGLLIPRVSRERAQSMTGVPNSTMIYVNDIVAGTQTGTAANIDTVGYYYFDETNVWAKLNGANSSAADTSIYNIDGTLQGNRIVAQQDKTLAFVSNATSGDNHFSIVKQPSNIPVLSLNAVNDRIGIGGTIVPQKNLHVYGTAQITNELNVGGDAATAGNSGIAGQILTSGGPSASTSWTSLPKTAFIGNIYKTTGAVTTFNASGVSQVMADANYITSSFGFITIVKSGYYKIIASTNQIVSTSGTATTKIQKNGTDTTGNTLAIASTYHAAGTTNVYHTLVAVSYFTAGEYFTVPFFDTSGMVIGDNSNGQRFNTPITVTYLGG